MSAHIHLIGIGGTGLSAIAKVLLARGYRVSGSDRQKSELAAAVERAGGQVFVGHRAEQIENADLVVRSSAIPDENVEVQAALARGIPVLKRADFLGRLLESNFTVAVAGTHGKTTTTGMIAWMLAELQQSPSYILGGTITNLGTNAYSGAGAVFVIEADEYDRMFLGLSPDIAIITNVEHDHPDCYPTAESFFQAFRDFVSCISPDGLLIACGDDPGASEMISVAAAGHKRVLTYGLQNLNCDYTARNISQSDLGGLAFDFYHRTTCLAAVQLAVPGTHNALNALAALVVADQLKFPVTAAAAALSAFQGTGRRFQIIGEAQGITVVSDYAHHPTEIQATLAGARLRYPARRIWAIWQPHTYSRTKMLLNEFKASFAAADQIMITEVFPAREPVEPDFSAAQIVTQMDQDAVHFAPNFDAALQILTENLQSGDVVIVLSAGDADQICNRLLLHLG